MRFVEASCGLQARRLTQGEAARLLGVCDRHFAGTWTVTRTRVWTVWTGWWTNGPVCRRRVVHRYRDGHLAVFHGPRKLADYARGRLDRRDRDDSVPLWAPERTR